MKNLYYTIVLIAFIPFSLAAAYLNAASIEEDAKVAILSPEEKEVIKGSEYLVKFSVELGKRGEHVHIFLDGRHLGPAGRFTSYRLTELANGAHSVTIKLADKKHRYFGPEATVNFTVEDSAVKE